MIINKRKYGGSVFRAAKRVAGSVVAAAGGHYAGKSLGQYLSGGSMAKTGTHGSGVSLQRDRQVQYVSKHKRGWKKRARRIKRFTSRVRSVIQKGQGQLTTILDDFYNSSTVVANTQLFQFVLLGGYNGNAAGENDVNLILDSAKSTNTDATRLMLNTKVLDLQITTTEATESSCELDVYEFVCVKDVPNSSVYSAVPVDLSMSTFYARGFLAQPTVGASGTVLNGNVVGVTPFDNKFFCKHFKIIKKTKYLLGLNQYITYQIRDPKNKMITGYQRRDLIARKGVTRGVLLIAKGLNAGGEIPTTDISVYANRHYLYSVVSEQTDKAETR